MMVMNGWVYLVDKEEQYADRIECSNVMEGVLERVEMDGQIGQIRHSMTDCLIGLVSNGNDEWRMVKWDGNNYVVMNEQKIERPLCILSTTY